MMDAYPFLQRNFHFFFVFLNPLKTSEKYHFFCHCFFWGFSSFPLVFSAAFFRILKAGRAAGQSLVLWQEAARRTLDVSLEDT